LKRDGGEDDDDDEYEYESDYETQRARHVPRLVILPSSSICSSRNIFVPLASMPCEEVWSSMVLYGMVWVVTWSEHVTTAHQGA